MCLDKNFTLISRHVLETCSTPTNDGSMEMSKVVYYDNDAKKSDFTTSDL